MTFLYRQWRNLLSTVLFGVIVNVLLASFSVDAASTIALVLASLSVVGLYLEYRITYVKIFLEPKIDRSERIGRGKLAKIYKLTGKSLDQCEQCGESRVTCDIHHKKPLSKEGTNKPENLMVFCPTCHRIEHKAMRDG